MQNVGGGVLDCSILTIWLTFQRLNFDNHMTMFTEANLIGRRHERELMAKGESLSETGFTKIKKKIKKLKNSTLDI